MKRAIPLLVLLAVAAYGASLAWAQGYNTQYTCQKTSVTSSTVPVNVLPVAPMTTWICHADSGALGVLAFPYPGAIPSAAPTNTVPFDPGAYVSDAVACSTNTCKDAIGEAWGAVLTTGSTAVNVSCCYR